MAMDKWVAEQYLGSVSADGLPLIGSTIFAGYGSAAGQVSDNDPKSLFGTKYDGVYFVKVLWNGDGEMRVKPDGISWNQQQVDAVQCITSRMADGSVRLRFTAPNGHEGRWESFDIKFEPNKSEFVGAFQRQGEGILTTRGRNNGDTALILACANKNEAAAALLMEATQKAGALDVQGGDKERSALHYASVNGWESAVAKLLSLGADAALRDKDGKTALILFLAKSEAFSSEATTVLLLEATQKAGALDVQGTLHIASRHGWESAVAKLLSLGADAGLKDGVRS